ARTRLRLVPSSRRSLALVLTGGRGGWRRVVALGAKRDPRSSWLAGSVYGADPDRAAPQRGNAVQKLPPVPGGLEAYLAAPTCSSTPVPASARSAVTSNPLQ